MTQTALRGRPWRTSRTVDGDAAQLSYEHAELDYGLDASRGISDAAWDYRIG